MATVLIVDDDPAVRISLRRALERALHNVLEAADARDGVQQFLRAEVDVVITDLVMPCQAGVVLIDRIRELDGDVPIIAISGEDQPGGPLNDAMLMGANMRIGKPFEVPDLLAAVELLISSEPDSTAP